MSDDAEVDESQNLRRSKSTGFATLQRRMSAPFAKAGRTLSTISLKDLATSSSKAKKNKKKQGKGSKKAGKKSNAERRVTARTSQDASPRSRLPRNQRVKASRAKKLAFIEFAEKHKTEALKNAQRLENEAFRASVMASYKPKQIMLVLGLAYLLHLLLKTVFLKEDVY